MLKKTLIAVFALAIAVQANAKGGIVKTEWGITAGIRYNSLSLKGAPDGMSAKPDLTYNAGLHASIAFLGIAIQPELNYGYTSVTLKHLQGGQLAETKVKAHDLEVPVLLSLRFLPVVRFNVGPVFNIMSKANYNGADGSTMYGPLHPSVGYAAGVSVCLLRKLLIDARFVGYFKPSDTQFEGVDFRTRNYSGGIKIGYLF